MPRSNTFTRCDLFPPNTFPIIRTLAPMVQIVAYEMWSSGHNPESDYPHALLRYIVETRLCPTSLQQAVAQLMIRLVDPSTFEELRTGVDLTSTLGIRRVLPPGESVPGIGEGGSLRNRGNAGGTQEVEVGESAFSDSEGERDMPPLFPRDPGSLPGEVVSSRQEGGLGSSASNQSGGRVDGAPMLDRWLHE